MGGAQNGLIPPPLFFSMYSESLGNLCNEIWTAGGRRCLFYPGALAIEREPPYPFLLFSVPNLISIPPSAHSGNNAFPCSSVTTDESAPPPLNLERLVNMLKSRNPAPPKKRHSYRKQLTYIQPPAQHFFMGLFFFPFLPNHCCIFFVRT